MNLINNTIQQLLRRLMQYDDYKNTINTSNNKIKDVNYLT